MEKSGGFHYYLLLCFSGRLGIGRNHYRHTRYHERIPGKFKFGYQWSHQLVCLYTWHWGKFTISVALINVCRTFFGLRQLSILGNALYTFSCHSFPLLPLFGVLKQKASGVSSAVEL